jgi:hypothetical protein
LKRVKTEYVQNDGKIDQKDRYSTHVEKTPVMALELVKLGNELGRRHGQR